jgi:ketosteroid isomerase-like protein
MKRSLLLTLAGFAIGFVLPALAQEQNTVDPEVRQQIEVALTKYDEAFNKNDVAATAALYTQDAVEVIRTWSQGGLASGQQAIKSRLATEFASGPSNLSHKLLHIDAIGNDVCAIVEWSLPPVDTRDHYAARIYVREADDWKIRMAYIY